MIAAEGGGRVEVGVVLPAPVVDKGGAVRTDVVQKARHLENLEFDSLWASDHLATGAPSLECFTALSAAAAVTESIQLGAGVLVPALRPIAWVAKHVASLQLLSNHRLLLGVGSGGPWPEEWDAVDVEYGDRGQLTDQALAILPRLINGQATVARPENGQQVHLEPGVPRPPILIGGSSSAALRRTLEYGDGWFPSIVSPDIVRSGRHHLGSKNPKHRYQIVVGFVASLQREPAARDRMARDLTERYGLEEESAQELPITGSPQQAAERLADFVEAGADHLVVGIDGQNWEHQTELLAETRARLWSA